MSNDMKMYNGYVDDDHYYIDEQPAAAAGGKAVFFPTCRFCGKQTLPDADYDSQETANEAGNVTLRLLRGAAVSRRGGKGGTPQGKYRPPSPTP